MRHSALLLAALVVVTAGCRRKPPAAPTPAPVPAAADDSADRARREAAEREAARLREEERLRNERLAADRARAAARDALLATVYFDYDRSDLDARARATLDAKLPVLQANADVRVRIAGHTDERGADEYNLALGQRRAAAAKRYLTQRGIDDARIELASFGEERPVCTDAEETCWSQNRRDVFEITVGTLASVPPTPPDR